MRAAQTTQIRWRANWGCATCSKARCAKFGRRVRIAGQLINSATDAHIWAERFDGTLDDVFDLQDRVASGVAGAIEPKLWLAEIERAGRKPTESLDAYDLYLRAQAQVFKRSEQSMAESVRLARKALELDPGYALAMARLGLSQMMRYQRHWIPAAGREVEEGIRMARQAIAAGGDDPLVLDFAGLTLSVLAGDNDAALSALDHAIVAESKFRTGLRASRTGSRVSQSGRRGDLIGRASDPPQPVRSWDVFLLYHTWGRALCGGSLRGCVTVGRRGVAGKLWDAGVAFEAELVRACRPGR